MALLDLTLVLVSIRPIFFCFRSINILKIKHPCGFMHVSAGAQRGQKRDQEVNAVMSCPKWVLGNELGSATRVVRALKC